MRVLSNGEKDLNICFSYINMGFVKMNFTDKSIILSLDEEDMIEEYLPKGFVEREKTYELGDSIEVYQYYYPNDDDVISVVYDYYNEKIIITKGKIGEILDEIEHQVLKAVAKKHGEFNDDQLDYNYYIEIFYPDYWSATADDHSISSGKGYWDKLTIELFSSKKIVSSLMKIEKNKISIKVWVSIGKNGTKIISVSSDELLYALSKIIHIELED